MTPEREREFSEMFDQLFAAQIVAAAKIDSIFLLLETISKQHGIEKIDGVSLREWFTNDHKEKMLNLLIKLGDEVGDQAYISRLTEKIKSLG